jgi:hypothetical protein
LPIALTRFNTRAHITATLTVNTVIITTTITVATTVTVIATATTSGSSLHKRLFDQTLHLWKISHLNPLDTDLMPPSLVKRRCTITIAGSIQPQYLAIVSVPQQMRSR